MDPSISTVPASIQREMGLGLKRRILALIGAFKTDDEIARLFRSEGRFVPRRLVREIREDPENLSEILAIRDMALGRLLDCELADKRVRLRRMAILYDGTEDPEFRLMVLDQARKEMADPSVSVTLNQTVNQANLTISPGDLKDEDVVGLLSEFGLSGRDLLISPSKTVLDASSIPKA